MRRMMLILTLGGLFLSACGSESGSQAVVSGQTIPTAAADAAVFAPLIENESEATMTAIATPIPLIDSTATPDSRPTSISFVNTSTPIPSLEPATLIPTQSIDPTATSIPSTETPVATQILGAIVYQRAIIIDEYPHDASVFTQGLLIEDGLMYESGGLYGQSSIRIVNLVENELVLEAPVDDIYFAEGLAKVDDRLIQLTWKAGIAFIWQAGTLEPLGQFAYDGQGWGLCYDGRHLWMSSGSDQLQKRDPDTFELLETLSVTLEGVSINNINELECVDDHVYANIWFQNEIMRIDKDSGNISAVIDASNLLTAEEQALLTSNDVLNGIAYDEENDIFYLTGKRWPKLFAVNFESDP